MHKPIRFSLIACLFVVLLGVSCPAFGDDGPKVDRELREAAVKELHSVLANEQRWVKVHAAEYLIELDYLSGVQEIFEKEREKYQQEPQYRIGTWRVLYKASPLAEHRQEWIDLIRKALFGDENIDRLHAVETLSKLKYHFSKDEIAQARKMAAEWSKEDAVFIWWALLQSGDKSAEQNLRASLQSESEVERLRSAYALQRCPKLTTESLDTLLSAAQSEPKDSTARAYLLASALTHSKEPDVIQTLRPLLLEYAQSGKPDEKRLAVEYLAAKGTGEDLPLLKTLLKDESGDVRASVAYAVLRIARRAHLSGHWLDWVVIALYGLSMIGIGYYYMRRAKSSEDYLLGGRRMKSWTVGLSLFATFMSTLTYLAIPGEIIKNGPMFLCQYFSIPIVFVVVGWFVIPFIMKLRVTSAYEILEKRFGCSVRLLGAVIFLSLRLLWMAVIIYATTNKALVPLMGLDPSWTPWLCVVMGTVTLIYTSMGGFQAVVVTDVAQTFILFGGAVLTIIMVAVSLGGVGQWWPQGWITHWEMPLWGFEAEGRITLGWALLSFAIWHICTNTSDQMAIQRFLATRDAKAARGVLLTNLIAIGLLALILSVVGLALLAYFQANPHALADGQRIAENADSLLPQYVMFAMPQGIGGLVIAGLLAAAMSSLSSGVNSSSSVITVDFIDRFRRSPLSDSEHLKLAKRVSIGVGVVVVAASFLVDRVPGNLLEVCYRAVNLLTVPLAILFFMALFIRWATPFGTWAGALASTASAVLIGYWEPIFGSKGPSFMWIMPFALVVGMVTGMLLSLAPYGKRATASISDIMLE